MRVGYVGRVGDDPAGRLVLELLAGRGVDVSACQIDEHRPTGVTVVLADAGERAILTLPGTIPTLSADDVPEAILRHARHVHVSAFFLQDALRPDVPALFAQVRSSGGTTSLDTNWDPTGRWGSGLPEALAQTDVFTPNAAEAIAIAGAATPDAALAVLGESVDTVAVKLGADGAIACRGAERARAAAAAVVPVDTTGAGDSFAAGLLFGLIHGRSLQAALALAVACGTLATRTLGGIDGQATLEDAERAVGFQPRLMEGRLG